MILTKETKPNYILYGQNSFMVRKMIDINSISTSQALFYTQIVAFIHLKVHFSVVVS